MYGLITSLPKLVSLYRRSPAVDQCHPDAVQYHPAPSISSPMSFVPFCVVLCLSRFHHYPHRMIALKTSPAHQNKPRQEKSTFLHRLSHTNTTLPSSHHPNPSINMTSRHHHLQHLRFTSKVVVSRSSFFVELFILLHSARSILTETLQVFWNRFPII